MALSILPILILAQAVEVDPRGIEDLYAHSVQVAEETCRRFPRQARPLADLAQVHQRFGFDDRAVQTYRDSLALEARQPHVLMRIGFLLSQRFQDDALAAYRQALKLDPGTGHARTRIGLILAHQGRHREAVEALRGEVYNRTADAATYMVLGQALHDLGLYSEAVASYREALRLDHRERGALYGLAQSYQALGKREDETRARRRFLEMKTKEDRETKAQAVEEATQGGNREEQLGWTAEAYHDAAMSLLDAGATEDGVRRLRGALRFDPRLEEARRRLVELLRDSGQVEEAIAQCREGLAAARTSTIAYLLAGLLLERDSTSEAGTLLEEAAGMGGAEAFDARRELARLILRGRLPGGFPRALRLAEEAVEGEPTGINFDMLGWARFATDDLPGALEAVETAVRLEPRNEDFRRRLEQVRRRKG